MDHYRPVHGRDFVDRPRQGVLAGTTNSDDYLRDQTGNSRMWPVPCRSVDLRWLTIHRDQLWAEAAMREASGEAVWLDDHNLQATAGETTETRMSDEVWQPAVLRWLADPSTNLDPDKAPVTSSRVLEEAIGMPRERMTKAASMRIGAVLRGLGWERHWATPADGKKGHSMRVWRPPETPSGGGVDGS